MKPAKTFAATVTHWSLQNRHPGSNAKKVAATVSPFAGKPATPAMLVDVPRLVTAYYIDVPDSLLPEQQVAFGTSGHRGSAFECTFNEWHVLAISQAICDLQDLRRELWCNRKVSRNAAKRGS
jgi:hypothetical protein